MAQQAKLGRTSAHKISMLKNLVTDMVWREEITTLDSRAREVRRIVEKLVTLAISEADNFTAKQVHVTMSKRDGKNKKVMETRTSKSGAKYQGTIREEGTREVRVDSPSRLHARRFAMKWIRRVKDADGKDINLVNKLFDQIAVKYRNKKGGYTKIYKKSVKRSGDGAQEVILKFV